MNRAITATEAKSLLREAVTLNIKASRFERATSFSEERDEIIADLDAAGFPSNVADYEHPSDV